MPLYEYECTACGHRFELIQRFADPPVETCVSCGQGPVHKLLSAPAVHFKGTGWYVTDYANKKSDGSPKTDAGAPKAGSAEKTDAATKSDAASSGSTPAAASSDSGGEKKSEAKDSSQ
jgi:putative FmdB family regulatory protein